MEMNVTRVIFSTSRKWFLEINNDIEIEISEYNAERLIKDYALVNYNMFRWASIKNDADDLVILER